MVPERPRRLRVYRIVTWLLDVLLVAPFARRRYRVSALPVAGPLLVAPNHVSVLDPIAVAAAVTRAGRIPRFVVTAEVLRWPVVGPVLRYFDHIALDRGRPTDPRLLAPVRAALRRGECVVLYPEGGVTRAPDYRPGRPLPGLGVLAAELGVPVAPIAQWGAQHVIGRGRLAWRALPPRRAELVVVSLPLLRPDNGFGGVLAARRFAGKVMDAIRAEVEALAGGVTQGPS